jgi:hypothetical protein
MFAAATRVCKHAATIADGEAGHGKSFCILAAMNGQLTAPSIAA